MTDRLSWSLASSGHSGFPPAPDIRAAARSNVGKRPKPDFRHYRNNAEFLHVRCRLTDLPVGSRSERVMRESLTSVASARCALNALDQAKSANSAEDRKFYLNQAAIYAHLSEQARREKQTGD